MNLSTQRKIYIVGGAFLVTVVLLVWLLFGQFVGEVIALSGKLSQKQDIQQDWAKKRAQFSKVKEDYKNADLELKTVDSLLTHKDSLINLIIDLESLADKTANQHEIKTVSQATNASLPSSVTLRLTLRGGFTSALKFIKTLENMPVLVQIQALNISRLDGANIAAYNLKNGDVETNFELVIYLNE